MALEKEDLQQIIEALRAPDPRVLDHEAKRAAGHAAKRAKLHKETKKSKTHAFYKVTQQSYVSGVGLLNPGEIVELPLAPVVDADGVEHFLRPSHTWEAVRTQKDIDEAREAAAEAEAEANEIASMGDDPVEDAPKTPVAGKKPKTPVAGKKRAADQDVA